MNVAVDDEGVLITRAVELLNQRYEENHEFNEFLDSEGDVEIGTATYSRSLGKPRE